jgi:hypothetical protein
LGFDPYNHSLKIRECTRNPTLKVEAPLGVWRFIPSNFPSFLASFLACNLASPCLGCEPKARVTTLLVTSWNLSWKIDDLDFFLQNLMNLVKVFYEKSFEYVKIIFLKWIFFKFSPNKKHCKLCKLVIIEPQNDPLIIMEANLTLNGAFALYLSFHSLTKNSP